MVVPSPETDFVSTGRVHAVTWLRKLIERGQTDSDYPCIILGEVKNPEIPGKVPDDSDDNQGDDEIDATRSECHKRLLSSLQKPASLPCCMQWTKKNNHAQQTTQSPDYLNPKDFVSGLATRQVHAMMMTTMARIAQQIITKTKDVNLILERSAF